MASAQIMQYSCVFCMFLLIILRKMHGIIYAKINATFRKDLRKNLRKILRKNLRKNLRKTLRKTLRKNPLDNERFTLTLNIIESKPLIEIKP